MKKTGLIMIMIVTILLMVVFIVFTNWKQSIDVSKLVEIDGLCYVSQTTKLFTGESFEKYENGTIKRKENWKDGLRNGKTITYYENGKIDKKEVWKKGELQKNKNGGIR